METLAAGSIRPSAQRIDGIQVLRAVAALLVVFGHSVEVLAGRGHTPFINIHLARFFATSGVFIFVMISGFIMVTSSIQLYDKPHGSWTFITRRICRIVPLYWIATLLYVAKLTAIGDAPDFWGVVKSLFFIPYNGIWPDMHPIFGVGWTLDYEMEFYVLFALSLLFAVSRGLPLLLTTLAAIGSVGFFESQGGIVPPDTMVEYWIDPVILLFAGGMVMGLLRLRLQKAGRLVQDHLFVGLVLALVIVSACALYVYQDRSMYWVRPVFCVVILSMFAFSATPAMEDRLRSLLIKLGNASYSIYLLHSLISGILARIWARFFLHFPPQVFIVEMLVVSSILGLLAYRYFEKPLLNASVRLFSVRSKKPVVSQVY